MNQHIGTSGFSYPYWKNRFYPEGLAVSKWLAYYASVFDTVELNGTFYRFPTVKTLSAFAGKVPDGFQFSVKAHKIITHTMRLRNTKDKIDEFLDICHEGLGGKLGCVLYQLPPSYRFEAERLEDVLANIPHGKHSVVEFRNASWWTEEVFDAFRQVGMTFCSVSYPGLPDDTIDTSGLIYRRMHGVPELFKSAYESTTLNDVAAKIKDADAYVYFNNTSFEAGYENAIELKGLVAI